MDFDTSAHTGRETMGLYMGSNMGICISKSLNRVNFSHCIKGNILGNTKTNQYTFLFRAICEEKAMQMQIYLIKMFFLMLQTDWYFSQFYMPEILIYYSKMQIWASSMKCTLLPTFFYCPIRINCTKWMKILQKFG